MNKRYTEIKDVLNSVKEVCAAIEKKSGVETEIQSSTSGIAIDVPSAKSGIFNFSLLPISVKSRGEFVDFMCSLVGKKPR